MSSALYRSCSHLLSAAFVSPSLSVSVLFLPPHEPTVAPSPSSVSTSPPLISQCGSLRQPSIPLSCAGSKNPKRVSSFEPNSEVIPASAAFWVPFFLLSVTSGSTVSRSLWCSRYSYLNTDCFDSGDYLPTEGPPPADLLLLCPHLHVRAHMQPPSRPGTAPAFRQTPREGGEAPDEEQIERCDGKGADSGHLCV